MGRSSRTSRATSRAGWIAVWGLVLAGVLVALGPGSASACSCASIHPVDAVGYADTVFTGEVLGNEGSEAEPRWRFAVDGVVKGEVEPVELVEAEDWAVGCGTNFSHVSGSVAVYARRAGDGLEALGCMPVPSAAVLADLLATESAPPTGTGLPAAVLVGTVGFGDVAVLDERGRTIERADLGVGAGVAGHCPGTPLAAVVASEGDRSGEVAIVDLETLSVVARRPITSGFLQAVDHVACIDGGELVVATAGFAPNEGQIRVAVSNADGDDHTRTFGASSRAIPHPDGTVLLVPWTVDDPLIVLSADDLEPVAEFELPRGTSAIDGAVSPDGRSFAILATIDGSSVDYDTGATHVILVDLQDGLPVGPAAARSFQIVEPGGTIAGPHGAAKWLAWVDDDTLVIERETMNSKRMQRVDADGAAATEPRDVGWGWGLAPVATGVLRARQGGVEIVTADGTPTPGDPAPTDDYIDRFLSIAPIVDAPDFTVAVADPVDVLTIHPVGRTGSAEDPGEQSTTTAPGDAAPRQDSTAGTPDSGDPDVVAPAVAAENADGGDGEGGGGDAGRSFADPSHPLWVVVVVLAVLAAIVAIGVTVLVRAHPDHRRRTS